MTPLRFFHALLAAGLLLSQQAAGAAPTVAPDVEERLRHDGGARLVVALDGAAGKAAGKEMADAARQAREEVLREVRGRAVGEQPSHLPVLFLEATAADLPVLRAHPRVRAIQLDGERHLLDAGSHALTRAPEVHAAGFTGEGVRVAVIDSGINGTHQNLADDLLIEACFRTEDDCPNGTSGAGSAIDQDGHGTHVAGIITGAGGVAPDAGIIALKVFTTASTTDSNIMNALNAVVANHEAWQTDIINLSIGGDVYPSQAACDTVLGAYKAVFSQLNGMGISIFAATGNDSRIDGVSAPACVSGAIGVGSVGDAEFIVDFPGCMDDGAPDKVSCFSNATPVRGAGELVDLLAPGCVITSEYVGGDTSTGLLCGTSMASPAAAGIAAMLLQADPGLAPIEIEVILEATGAPVTDYRSGISYPRVDAMAALSILDLPLDAPSTLSAVGLSTTEVLLAWEDVDGETGYEIMRSSDGETWATIGGVLGDATSFLDDSATCGLLFYRVRAVNTQQGTMSGFSPVAHAQVSDCLTPPHSIMTMRMEGNALFLSWQHGSGGTHYELERGVAGGEWEPLATLPVTQDGYLDEAAGCDPSRYRLRSVHAVTGERSPYSLEMDAEACPPPLPPGDFRQLLPEADAVIHRPIQPSDGLFSWEAAEGATEYVFFIEDAEGLVVEVSGLTTTSHSLDVEQRAALLPGNHRWSVLAINEGGVVLALNAWRAFTVKASLLLVDGFEG